MAADSIAVNGATRYQTMNGWETHARSWEIDKINDRYDATWPVHAQAVANLMVNELGINRIQLPIRSGWENPVDYWTKYVNQQISYTEMKSHWYEKINDNANPAIVNPSGFQFSEFDFRVETMLLPMKQLLAARGEKLYVNVVFVDFGAIGGYLTGSMEFSRNPAEYAEFVQVYLDRLKTKYGVTADALEIVNEPENTDLWRGTEIGQALVAVSNRLVAAGYTNLNYIGPTTASAGNALPYMSALAAVPGALSKLKTLAYHRYGLTDFNAVRTYAQANNLQTDMSEFFNATVDQLIEDLTVANVSSWQKWAIANRTGGSNPQAFYYLADLSNPASPVFSMAPNTALMAQFFRYVRLGAVRIAAQSSVAARLPVAFINANGSYVVVVKTNAGTGAQPVTFSGLPVGTYGVRTTSFAGQAADLADVVTAANGTATVTVPEGITTVYGKSAVPPPPPPPTSGVLSISGTLTFASQTVGTTSAARAITVTNVGGSPVVVQSIVSSNAAEFPVTSSTCGTVNPAGSCTFAVAFKPTAAGARSATLTLTSNGIGSPQTLAASGTGTATVTQGQLSISGTLVFASQTVGTTSAAKTITVTNVGGSPVVMQSIVSSNAAEFPVTSSTCGTVTPAGSCTFAVAFKPTAAGARTATLTLTSNGIGSPQTLAASGTGTTTVTQGQLSISGTPVFASQMVGTTSTWQALTVTNIGGSPVVVQSIVSSNAAEFPITTSSCGTVNPSATCTFTVAFKPSAAGARSGTLTISSNGIGSPQALTASGTGVATAGPGKLSLAGSVTFASQVVGTTSAASTVTVSNTGSTAVVVQSIVSSNAAEFPIVGSTCGTVSPAGSCTFAVAFKPSVTGARSATLTVTSTGEGNPQTLPASGTGVPAALQGQLSITGLSPFASQSVGTASPARTVTLLNVGAAPVSVHNILSSNPSEFSITGSTCVIVNPGSACTFAVTFRPTAAGTRSATLTIASNGMGSPQVLTVNGIGTGGLPPPPPSGAIAVVEYYHAQWDHYFMTGIETEIAMLDNGVFTGWTRTGLQITAYPMGAAAGSPVCRFFSTAFDPRSSHFYTSSIAECSIVNANPDWALEGHVFKILVPDAGGTCAAGTIPVYRMYNNGQGGAPNHRFTSDLAARTQMIDNGWIPEGYGYNGVIMCAPQ